MQELTISFLYEKLKPADETVGDKESDEFFQGVPGNSPHATSEWKCMVYCLWIARAGSGLYEAAKGFRTIWTSLVHWWSVAKTPVSESDGMQRMEWLSLWVDWQDVAFGGV